MVSPDGFEIARLIAARIDGTITAADNERLEAWLGVCAANRRFYDDLVSEGNIERRIGEYERLDLSRVKSRTISNISARKPGRTLRRTFRVAVAAAVVVAAATWYFMERYGTGMTPDRKTAYLETSDGRTFDLGAEVDTVIVKSGGDVVRAVSGGLEYVTGSDAGAELRYDRIIVPRGCEYKVALPDGSRVWLNSASELRYAASGAPATREVHLVGEAYFEVVRSERPFIVNTSGVSVRVLGTSFNVSAYPDDHFVSATLTAGSVEVLSDATRRSVVLAPGEQANIAPGGAIEVRRVDPAAYSGWKDDIFVFNEEDFGTIVRKLSRWYDVDIVLEDAALNSLTFYGVMQKHEDVSTILDMMKKTYPIDYRITRDRITIRGSE